MTSSYTGLHNSFTFQKLLNCKMCWYNVTATAATTINNNKNKGHTH